MAYGYPGAAMVEADRRGLIALGGCGAENDASMWECRMCRHRPGQPVAWTAVDGPRDGEFADCHRVLDAAAMSPGMTPRQLDEFALSFDAYAAFGPDTTAAVSREVRKKFIQRGRFPGNLAALRAGLFEEQRAAHHRGDALDGDYVPALLAAIGAPRSRPPVLDGLRPLEELAGTKSILQLLAENTVFLHPDTVVQTGGQPVFPVVRHAAAMRGRVGTVDGFEVLYCDNTTPTRAFLWAAGCAPGRDVQYNHVWQDATNPTLYTALWNLCVTPAFLARLTDGKQHPETVAALRCRSFELYGQLPAGLQPPAKPDRYDKLEWREPPAPVPDLEAELRRRLASAPRSRAAQAANRLGWLFSDWRPDPSIGTTRTEPT